MNPALLRKYNVPAPRYTSYPTVPYWRNPPAPEEWRTQAKEAFKETNTPQGISVYIHIPFCEHLCTYCGCTTRITQNHGVEGPYVNALLKEWKMYMELFRERPRIKEIHLGGGTPTFLGAGSLEKLVGGLLFFADEANEAEFSFEAHPNFTTGEQLKALYRLGFRRISLGVQDFDPRVQYIIHRVQPPETVEKVTREARETGYTSVNYDLIYGLPLQKEESIRLTMEKIRELRPDRIAFYSYAHIPWMKPGQRKFTETDVPSGEEKFGLYLLGKEFLLEMGYREIGMDHFSLPGDDLYRSAQNGTLHRNFMGYTPASTKLMLGLGVSSISDAWVAFVQNEKKLEDYLVRIEKNEFPFFRGHLLTQEDRVLRRHILNLMCRFRTTWEEDALYCDFLADVPEPLREMENDGLLRRFPNGLEITEEGRAFVRNICMAFDARLKREEPVSPVFSQAV